MNELEVPAGSTKTSTEQSAVGAEGDDRLHGFRGDTGEEIFTEAATGDGMTGLRHFATILVAGGHFYIAGDGRIFVYGLPQ